MWIASPRMGLVVSSFLLAAVPGSPVLGQATLRERALEDRLVVTPAPDSEVQLSLIGPRTPFLTDRDYDILRPYRGTYRGTLVVRSSRELEKWLPPRQVVAKEDCRVYVAIQTRRNREVRVPPDLAEQMTRAGWKEEEKGDFRTTSAEKETWIWAVFSKDVKKGPVDLKAPIRSRTAFIFMFTDESPARPRVPSTARPASPPWALAERFEWKTGQPEVKMIHRDDGFGFLTGVQGALSAGSELSILPNPEGNWTFHGTQHPKLTGHAVAVPWFVDVERPVTLKIWRKGEPGFPKLIHQRDGFCVPLTIGGAFNGTGEQFRLRVDTDGFWCLNARSLAPGTRVRVMVAKVKQPGSFQGVAREHTWRNGQAPVRLIHGSDGIAFLSGLSGAFAGEAEYALVRCHEDGYWYLEGRTRQGTLNAWAMSIQLSGPATRAPLPSR